jgi:hypothetical protein
VSEARFSCFFCDDVRHEVGGKISLMGVYTGSLIFHQYPFTLSTLSVVMRLSYPIEKKVESLKFLITDENSNEFVNEVSQEVLKQNYKDLQIARESDEKARYQIFNTIIKINSIEFTEKTYLKSKVIVNDEEFNGDGLVVRASQD